MLPQYLTNCFTAAQLPNDGLIYRWNLNNVPEPVSQILYMSEVIQHEMALSREIKIRPDKRKRAQGLLVIFSNPPKTSTSSDTEI